MSRRAALRDRLGEALRTYEPAVAAMLRWMQNDWISQDHFDALVARYRLMDRCWFMEPGTYLLGELGGGKKEIDLLCHLCRIGLVDSEMRGDLVFYRASAIAVNLLCWQPAQQADPDPDDDPTEYV
jgi:hypothetical protein